MAYARLHLASTLLVLVAVVLVPQAAGAPTGADVGTVLLPVAWAYVAVQVACALHVALVRAAGRTRRRAGRN